MGKTQSLPKYDGEGAKVLPVFRFSTLCIICSSRCNQEIKRGFMGGRLGTGTGLGLAGWAQGEALRWESRHVFGDWEV